MNPKLRMKYQPLFVKEYNNSQEIFQEIHNIQPFKCSLIEQKSKKE